MKKALWLILIVFIIIMSALFLQQYNNKKVSSDKNVIVTTIYPLYFIAKSVVGDSVTVERLIKPGSEIHSFSPTPTDMTKIDKSTLLITLGTDLEPWISKLITAIDVETLLLEENLTLLHNNEADHHHHEEHGVDPHVWLDFDNDIKMIDLISQRVSKIYPKHKNIFLKNATMLKNKFEDLKKSYRDTLKECKRDTILVGHDAFGYMEKRYGFKAESIMGIFANSRPNASKISKLSKLIELQKLKYLMMDPIESSKSAIQLATDMDLTILPLYTLGNIPLKDEKSGKDMIMLLDQNLKNLTKGLECR